MQLIFHFVAFYLLDEPFPLSGQALCGDTKFHFQNLSPTKLLIHGNKWPNHA